MSGSADETAVLTAAIDGIAAEHRFSGVLRVDLDGEPAVARAYGWANRASERSNTVDTRFGLASGAKGFTALTVVSLIVDGALDLATPARALLGDDLPEIAGDVTVEHLLAHTSGIGDYADEEADGEIDDYVLPVPVHQLATTEHYVTVLGGFPSVAAPGERFAYNNGAYVVLALIAERAADRPFHDLVDERVCRPAGLVDTAFLRSDELPDRTALGYLSVDGLRTNVLHLAVRGSGDGGIYSTADDIHRLWGALDDGRIVPPEWVAEMTRPRNELRPGGPRYGLGFWLAPDGDAVQLEGFDAGVSFRSVHSPSHRSTVTMIANTSEGAWPVADALADLVADGGAR